MTVSLPSFALRCLTVCVLLASARLAAADSVRVRFPQGTSRGFLVLKDLDGRVLASGDLFQTIQGSRVTSRLTFHFRDGSVDDDTTVYSQAGKFELIHDHHVQCGPSFPKPIDVTVDVPSGTLTSRSVDHDGNSSVTTEHLDLSSDVSNGLVSTLVANIPFGTQQTSVSYVATSGSKARPIHLDIRPTQLEDVRINGRMRKAMDFTIKIQLGGAAGAIAPVIGKQPEDAHIWVMSGPVPSVLAEQSPMYLGGPIWRVELTSPSWPQAR